MKTPIFEEYFLSLIKRPKFGYHLLIGAILCCIPIAHFFAFGYLYQVTNSVSERQRLQLPEWSNWGQLFKDGLSFSLPWFFFWLCPIILANVLKLTFVELNSSLLGTLAMLAGLLLATFIFPAALFCIQKTRSPRALLNYRSIINLSARYRWQLLLPCLVALAILLALPQIYGFAYFASSLVCLPYCVVLLTQNVRL
jgi:hypothetical protein